MDECSELLELVRRFYDGINRQEPAAVASLISDDEAALLVGTEGADWWVGGGVIADVLSEKIVTNVGFELVGDDPRAYAEDGVGWFADRPLFRMTDGTTVPTRLTGVAVRDAGVWRVVQGHWSKPH